MKSEYIKKFDKKEKRDLDLVINCIALNYRDNKKIILSCKFGKPSNFDEIKAFEDNAWLESSYKMLDIRYQPIIEMDVFKRFSGEKYSCMMSDSHYYRYKYFAYEAYKKILDK